MNTSFNRARVARKGSDRTRLIYIAAVGLSFSTLTLIMLVLNYKQEANAREDKVIKTMPQDFGVGGTVPLFVPDRMVSAGSSLTDIPLKEVYWPRAQVPEGAIMDRAELKGRFARIGLSAGVPVLRSQLSEGLQRDTLPLTPGMRAISIEVDEISGIEGHARPGTKVDVLLSFMDAGVLKTSMIVQNARVLSYGGESKQAQVDPSSNGVRPARISHSITLEATPKDAMKIHTARQLGRLGLMMRTDDDTKSPDIVELDQFEISNSGSAAAPSSSTCSRGTAKIGGAEYVVGCDGKISAVANLQEP